MEQHREKIEQYGVVLEKMGFTPVAARVFVYLLLCPGFHATFDELVNYFKVSKSAVSNAMKMLVNTKIVDTKTKGGQRKRYFFVNFAGMLSKDQILGKMNLFYNMLEDIRKTRNIKDEFDKELSNASVFYKMMMIEFPIILERWKISIEFNEKEN